MNNLLLLTLLSTIFISCDTSDDAKNQNSSEIRLKKEITRFNSGFETSIEYIYDDNNKLKRIIAENSRLPSSFDYEDGKITRVTYESDTSFNLIYDGETITSAINKEIMSQENYEYNNQNKLISTTTYIGSTLACEEYLSYDTQNNIQSIQETCHQQLSTTSYIYDDKINPNPLLLTGAYGKTLNISKNNYTITSNISKGVNTKNSFKYVYDDNNLPITRTQIDDDTGMLISETQFIYQ